MTYARSSVSDSRRRNVDRNDNIGSKDNNRREGASRREDRNRCRNTNESTNNNRSDDKEERGYHLHSSTSSSVRGRHSNCKIMSPISSSLSSPSSPSSSSSRASSTGNLLIMIITLMLFIFSGNSKVSFITPASAVSCSTTAMDEVKAESVAYVSGLTLGVGAIVNATLATIQDLNTNQASISTIGDRGQLNTALHALFSKDEVKDTIVEVSFISSDPMLMGYSKLYSETEGLYMGDGRPTATVTATDELNIQTREHTNGNTAAGVRSTLPVSDPRLVSWYQEGISAAKDEYILSQPDIHVDSNGDHTAYATIATPWIPAGTAKGVLGVTFSVPGATLGTIDDRLECNECKNGFGTTAQGCPAECDNSCGTGVCSEPNTCSCDMYSFEGIFCQTAQAASFCSYTGAGNLRSFTGEVGAVPDVPAGEALLSSGAANLHVYGHFYACASDRKCINEVIVVRQDNGKTLSISVTDGLMYTDCSVSPTQLPDATVAEVTHKDNTWTIDGTTIVINVVLSESREYLDVYIETSLAVTPNAGTVCAQGMTAVSITSETGNFCDTTFPTVADNSAIVAKTHTCKDSSVDAYACCDQYRTCNDLYRSCVEDHCVFASGECLDMSSRVDQLGECAPVTSGCMTNHSLRAGMTSFLIDQKSGLILHVDGSKDVPHTAAGALLSGSMSRADVIATSSQMLTELTGETGAITWTKGGQVYIGTGQAYSLGGRTWVSVTTQAMSTTETYGVATSPSGRPLELMSASVSSSASSLPSFASINTQRNDIHRSNSNNNNNNNNNNDYGNDKQKQLVFQREPSSAVSGMLSKLSQRMNLQAYGSVVYVTYSACNVVEDEDALDSLPTWLTLCMITVGMFGFLFLISIQVLFFDGDDEADGKRRKSNHAIYPTGIVDQGARINLFNDDRYVAPSMSRQMDQDGIFHADADEGRLTLSVKAKETNDDNNVLNGM